LLTMLGAERAPAPTLCTSEDLFRAVTRQGIVRPTALSGEAVRLIVLKRARLAGIRGTLLEPISPHGLRAGLVTSACRKLGA
jgi:hypothetical protein